MDARILDREPEAPMITPAGLIMAPARGPFSLSPINRRRWENFKRNRRGYASLWIFTALFILSMFAEFIANDKPFYVHVNGKSFFPVFVTYPDTAFGDKDDPNILHNEVTTIDHALTRPWTVTRSYHRDSRPQPLWTETYCTEDNHHVLIGNHNYVISGDGHLMPARKGEPPPDLRNFTTGK